MRCGICQNETSIIFEKLVLHKYHAYYYQCDSCGFIQTSTPTWLHEAYVEPMEKMDTGLLLRNVSLSIICSVFIYFFLNPKKSFLDFAGGYGIFVRLMRDIGFDFFWEDPHTTNLLARGFEHRHNQPIELITAIECFEHFPNPIEKIEELFRVSDSIFFTTELSSTKKPSTLEHWWYLGPEHGQHVSFYSEETLKYIASRFSCQLYTNKKNIHLLTRKKIKWFNFKFLSLLIKIGGMKYVRRHLKPKTQEDCRFLAQNHKHL